MTDKAYCNKCRELAKAENWNELEQFQYSYMSKIVAEFRKNATSTIGRIAYELIEYAVNASESGNSVVYLDDYELTAEEEAETIAAIEDGALDELLGEYLLDLVILGDTGDYSVDVMFGGCYVPNWDGWGDCYE